MDSSSVSLLQDADETGNGKNPGRNEGGNPILEKERSNSIIKKTPHLSSKGKSKSSISGDKEIESHPPPQQMIENDMSNLVQRVRSSIILKIKLRLHALELRLG